ncbi:transposase [Moorena sp. SIO4G3]|uniref:transposase n=1 Tax=Moorena sp. SIO4G3 TaxID=2607821 RepID=UPI00142A58AD|nr:transposase [Moorena sp. SIO4G3]NEO79852.1 transposase [Moorena sp. SIO4G3]
MIKQEFREKSMNRFQRRRAKKLKLVHQGYLLLALLWTQWKERNLIMLSLVWGNHAIPVYWELIGKKGNSSFGKQKKVIAPVLRLLRPDPVVLLGDREFQSVKLAKWLNNWGIDFALRQKKGTCLSDDDQVYMALKNLGIKPGMLRFYQDINYTKKTSVIQL